MARIDRGEFSERIEEMIVPALGARIERLHRERAHDFRGEVRVSAQSVHERHVAVTARLD